MSEFAILGGGKWGLTLASLMARKHANRNILVWIREASVHEGQKKIDYISTRRKLVFSDAEYDLPANIDFTSRLDQCTPRAIVINTIPSQYLKSYYEEFSFSADSTFVNASKGMIDGGLIYSSFHARFPKTNYLFLGGPNIAQEIMKSLQAASSPSPAFAILAANRINAENRRILDLVNVYPWYNVGMIKNIEANEWCSVLKQVYAVILGFLSGSKYDANTVSSVFQDCILEIFNIMSGLKFDPKIFIKSKVGIADLEVTYKYGRNGKFGRMIAEKGIEEAFRIFERDCVEGIRLIETIYLLCRRKRINTPLLEIAYSVLFERRSLDRIHDELLGRFARRD